MRTRQLAELEIFIEWYAEILGCDPEPAVVAAEMQSLKAEVDRARKTIADLRKQCRAGDYPRYESKGAWVNWQMNHNGSAIPDVFTIGLIGRAKCAVCGQSTPSGKISFISHSAYKRIQERATLQSIANLWQLSDHIQTTDSQQRYLP